MEQRVNVFEKIQSVQKAMHSLGAYLSKSRVEESLLNLIYFRVSQINGCAFCLDMHSKDLRAAGETEQRLYVIAAWRETPFFSKRERAALAYAESVTKLDREGVPDDVYNEAGRQFSEDELVDLTIGIMAINSYNRLNIAFRTVAGGYQPATSEAHANTN